MDIAMTMPTMVAHDRADTLAWCRAVDEGPFASLAVPERTTYSSHAWTVQLAAAAALTERVRLWTTVVVLPAHDEVDVAKQLASVDQLSRGRLTVGVGVGARTDDYRALSRDPSRRWERMDAQVARMRSVWSGEPPFEGADPVGPPPVQPGGPPLVAGVSGPKALARAARWAVGVDDGTTVFGVDPERAAGFVERVRTAWREADRPERPHLSASLWFALGDGADERLRSYCFDYMRVLGDDLATALARRTSCHSEAALRQAVSDLEAAGCDELFLVPTTTDVTELHRVVDAFAG